MPSTQAVEVIEPQVQSQPGYSFRPHWGGDTRSSQRTGTLGELCIHRCFYQVASLLENFRWYRWSLGAVSLLKKYLPPPFHPPRGFPHLFLILTLPTLFPPFSLQQFSLSYSLCKDTDTEIDTEIDIGIDTVTEVNIDIGIGIDIGMIQI